MSPLSVARQMCVCAHREEGEQRLCCLPFLSEVVRGKTVKSNGEDLCAGLVAAPQCQYSKLTGKNLGNSSKHRKTVPPSGHRPIQAQGEGDTCAHSHVGAWLWNLASWPHLLPPPPASAARWLARRGLDGAGRDGLSGPGPFPTPARCRHMHMCVLLLLACPPGLRGERPGLVHR